MGEQEVIDKLRAENEEYRALEAEHKALERALDEMNKRLHLSPEDEMERKTIQKQKLAKKDRMAELIRKQGEG